MNLEEEESSKPALKLTCVDLRNQRFAPDLRRVTGEQLQSYILKACFVLLRCCTGCYISMGIHLAGIVAAVSVFPASLTFLLRHKLPWPCTFALAHVSFVGFAVAVATTDQFAAHSTQLLAKVCAAVRDNAYGCLVCCIKFV